MLLPNLTEIDPTVTTGAAVVIDENTTVLPGDRVRFTFRLVMPGAFGEIEKAILENRITDKYPLKILGTKTTREISGTWYYIVLCRVLYPEEMPPEMEQAAGPLVIGLVVTGIVAGGLFGYLWLTKIEKITDSPAGEVALAGVGAAGVGIAVIAVIVLLGKLRQ